MGHPVQSSMSTGKPSLDEAGEPTLPVPTPPGPPSKRARQGLEKELVRINELVGCTLDPDAARVLARSVANASDVARVLRKVRSHRELFDIGARVVPVGGASSEAVFAVLMPVDLTAITISPNLVNVRETIRNGRAVAGADRISMVDTSPGQLELEVEAPSVASAKARLQKVHRQRRDHNTYAESMRSQGITEKILVGAVKLTFRDGTDPAHGTVAFEGDGRVALATGDIFPILHDFGGRSARIDNPVAAMLNADVEAHMRQVARNVGKWQQYGFPDGIQPEDPALVHALRNWSIRGEMLIAAATLDGTPSGQSIRTLVKRLMKQENRPKVPQGSSEDGLNMAEIVCDDLCSAGLLDEVRRDWMLGDVPPEEFDDTVPKHADQRAAAAAHTIFRPSNRRRVNATLRDLTSKQRTTAGHRAGIAATLATIVAPILETTREGTFSTLERSLRRFDAKSGEALGWSPTARPVDEILQGAVASLDEEGEPGADAQELGVLGLYHLALGGHLRRLRQTTKGSNRGEPHQVLDLMLRDEHGLRLLRQVVLDGRAGKAACRVDESGAVIFDEDGDRVPLDERWIRDTWADDGSPDPDPLELPEEVAWRGIVHKARLIEQDLRVLTDIDENSGQTPISTNGLPLSEGEEVLRVLRELSFEIEAGTRVTRRLQSLQQNSFEAGGKH